MKKTHIVTIEEALVPVTRGSARGAREGTIVIASPMDIGTFLVELPPLKDELVEGALRFKLRSMYPGAPQDTVVDFARNGPRGAYLAFAAQRADLRRYRDLRAPLTAGAHLLRSLPRGTEGGPRLAVLIAPRWLEAAVLDGTKLRSYAAAPRSERIEGDLDDLLAALALPAGPADSAVLALSGPGAAGPGAAEADAAQAEADAVDAALEALTRITGRRATRHGADELALGSKRAHTLLFTAPERRGAPAAVLAALVALNLIAASLALSRYADSRESRVSALRTEHRILAAKHARNGALTRELAALESAAATHPSRLAASAYGLLEEIAARMGGRAWVRSLTFRGDSFQLEAEGRDALEVLAGFEASAVLTDIRLHQANPLPAGGERFTLSGKVRYDQE